MAALKTSYFNYEPLGVDAGFLDRIEKIQPKDFYDAELEQAKSEYNQLQLDKLKQDMELDGPRSQAKQQELKRKQQLENMKTVEDMAKLDPELAQNMWDRYGLSTDFGPFKPKGKDPKIIGAPSTGIARIGDDGKVEILQGPMARPKDPSAGTKTPAFKLIQLENDAGDVIPVNGADEVAVRDAYAKGYHKAVKKEDDLFGGSKPAAAAEPSGPSWVARTLSSIYGAGGAQEPAAEPRIIVKRKQQSGMMIPRAR